MQWRGWKTSGDQAELTVPGKRKTEYILGNICGGRGRM